MSKERTLALLTVHSVAKHLCELYPQMEPNLLHVQAEIKRLIHIEKYVLLQRLKYYAENKEGKSFLEMLETQSETHWLFANKPDEEVVTWKW